MASSHAAISTPSALRRGKPNASVRICDVRVRHWTDAVPVRAMVNEKTTIIGYLSALLFASMSVRQGSKEP